MKELNVEKNEQNKKNRDFGGSLVDDKNLYD